MTVADAQSFENKLYCRRFIYDINECFDCKIIYNNRICEKIIISLFVLAVYHFRLSGAFHARSALCT